MDTNRTAKRIVASIVDSNFDMVEVVGNDGSRSMHRRHQITTSAYVASQYKAITKSRARRLLRRMCRDGLLMEAQNAPSGANAFGWLPTEKRPPLLD